MPGAEVTDDWHGPEGEPVFDVLRQENVLYCHCGHAARGCTWAEVGEEMDAHLEGAE